ncbi:MAG: hypothetical protein R6W76_10070, partial [Caldilinea sp.]
RISFQTSTFWLVCDSPQAAIRPTPPLQSLETRYITPFPQDLGLLNAGNLLTATVPYDIRTLL